MFVFNEGWRIDPGPARQAIPASHRENPAVPRALRRVPTLG